jgi:hypothetical protein
MQLHVGYVRSLEDSEGSSGMFELFANMVYYFYPEQAALVKQLEQPGCNPRRPDWRFRNYPGTTPGCKKSSVGR